MKRFFPILFVLMLFFAGMLFYRQRENDGSIPIRPGAQACSADNQCPAGHFCDVSWICPKGYPPERCKETGTRTCVKACSTDSECASGLSCQGIYISKGDAGERRNACLAREKDPRTICAQQGRKWLDEYQECEGMTQKTCEQSGGSYDSCTSACRHDPQYPNVPCIKICIAVCRFY